MLRRGFDCTPPSVSAGLEEVYMGEPLQRGCRLITSKPASESHLSHGNYSQSKPVISSQVSTKGHVHNETTREHLYCDFILISSQLCVVSCVGSRLKASASLNGFIYLELHLVWSQRESLKTLPPVSLLSILTDAGHNESREHSV